MRKKIFYSTFAGTFVLGSFFGFSTVETKEQPYSEAKTDAEANVMLDATKLIGHNELQQIVYEQVEGTIENLELNGQEQFEITVSQGNYIYDLTVDGVSGKVVSIDKQRVNSVQSISIEEAKKYVQTTIEKLDAIELALETVNGNPVQADLVEEKGDLIYLVVIEYGGHEYDVSVDAVSGVVLNVS
ncbi:PepSY domain-containing protein [Alkalibacillus haloalkaliphilus]|uniref:PepSY domain-containing protein n=1 Tax=Alkalibacillus haloalkaliphilus TaxID=94136 RepID=A0A511W7I3_9BACI|nr:PepSY domain-containing protein [Alkalibacillus haloalkaliphilus]GEN45352.1 hypothetical protein AHA02nite_11280 [Alkalibacillus haloalkaliphilus]